MNTTLLTEDNLTLGLRPEAGNKPSVSDIIFETPVTTGNGSRIHLKMSIQHFDSIKLFPFR